MDFTWSGVRARAIRSESGFARGVLLAGVGLAGTVGSLIAINPAERVAAAEESACRYEKTIVLTAIESDRALNDGYVEAAGADGMDGLRQSGFLLTESHYWIYQGLDENGRPKLVPRTPEECDSGAAEEITRQIGRIDPNATTTVAPTTAPPAPAGS